MLYHGKFWIGAVSVFLLVLVFAWPLLDGDKIALRTNIRTVATQMAAATTASAQMLVPDAYTFQAYLQVHGIELKKVWGAEPQIFSALNEDGDLDHSDTTLHQPGDLVIFSSGSSWSLWYFDQANQRVPVL